MPWPTFKTRDEIPEPFRSEYEEREGSFVAKVPDVSKIEETLGKVRTEKKDAERAAKDASDRAADLQRQLDAKSATGAETDRKVADMLAQWNKDKDAAVAAERTEREKLATELRTLKLDDRIKAAAIANGVRPEKVDAVLKLTKDSFDLADDRIVVKDDKGAVTTTTVEDFFGKSFRAQMPELYQGTKATGGGASGGASRQVTTSDSSAADLLFKNPLEMLRQAYAEAA